MTKQYFNAQELAGLPGMPSTVRGVRLKADKESWTKQKKAKGKGFEYYISSLPEQTRAYLAQQAAEEIAQASKGAAKKASTELARTLAVKDSLNASFTAQNRQKTLAKVAHLKGDEQKRAQSKLLVLAMWQAYVKKSNQGKTKATSQFLLLWSEDMLDIPAEERWIRNYVNTDLSLTTLYAWEKALESNSSRIWGNYGNRKGTSKIDRQPKLREFVIATIYEYPHIYATQLFEAVEVRFENTDIELPSKRSLERWVKAYKDANAQVFTAVTNPDKWKNKYMPAFGTVGVAALNEKWELDSTPADIMLSDGRYNLIGAIDVYSRRVKLLVSKSSTAASVSKLMRDCLLEWGVPDKVKTDNGADYVSLQIKTAFQSLGIEQDISAPFSPWEKPHIERFFRTFSHGLLEI
ncbi:MAG: DNA-binding protein, partial [Pseudomonadota bacterium]|nr:DNA-binding protein [Pseudomonadota bacterium]